MKSFVLCILTYVSCVIAAQASDLNLQERIGIDPVLRGVWQVYATSIDQGKNLDWQEPPVEFAVASATRLRYFDGSVVHFERVWIFTDDKGHPGNVVRLDTGYTLVITKGPESEFVVVLSYNRDFVEQMRYMIAVIQ